MPKIDKYGIFGPKFIVFKSWIVIPNNSYVKIPFIFLSVWYLLVGILENIITARFQELRTFGKYSA